MVLEGLREQDLKHRRDGRGELEPLLLDQLQERRRIEPAQQHADPALGRVHPAIVTSRP